MNRDELLSKLPRFIDRCKKSGYPVTDYRLYPAYLDANSTEYILQLELGHWNSTVSTPDQLSHIVSILNTCLLPADADHIIAIHLFDGDQHLCGIINID